MVGSDWNTLLLSPSTLLFQRLSPPRWALLRGIFEAKSVPKMGLGRPRWPSWEMDAAQPCPKQMSLSPIAGWVSVMCVADDCDERPSAGAACPSLRLSNR